jgi:hypothetical protein
MLTSRRDFALADYLARYQFTGVTASVPNALSAWLSKQWHITLCEHIPSPREVLQMQRQGIRPVTVLSDPERMRRPVLKKPNAYAFMVHDLEHAYKFFHDPELHAGQLRFFRRLENVEQAGAFDEFLDDPVFRMKFEYLISDMNTHVMHNLQYLRAILIETMLHREGKQPSDTLSDKGEAAVGALMSRVAPARDPAG